MTTREVKFTIAPRESKTQEGCIERASFTKQDAGREASKCGRAGCRVAWRALGIPEEDNPFSIWSVSCRTPASLRGADGELLLLAGSAIGDGTDLVMLRWLETGIVDG